MGFPTLYSWYSGKPEEKNVPFKAVAARVYACCPQFILSGRHPLQSSWKWHCVTSGSE